MTQITPRELTVTEAQYFRCPGCFDWALESTGTMYPPDTLHDTESCVLCPHCVLVLESGDYSDAFRVVDRIRVYAGWDGTR